eukprot:COSAG04_NODE_874_length_9706_cov_10.058083_10_plen_44_part_00
MRMPASRAEVIVSLILVAISRKRASAHGQGWKSHMSAERDAAR